MGSGSRSRSRSEGEYLSSDSEAKAIKPPSRRKVPEIDRHSRNHASSRRRESRSRSRSPYRAPKGEKRRREDNTSRRHNSRTFNVRYDDGPGMTYNDHGDRHSKRSRAFDPIRTRSRSPYRRKTSIDGESNRNHSRDPATEHQKTGFSGQSSASKYSVRDSLHRESNMVKAANTTDNPVKRNTEQSTEIAPAVGLPPSMDETALIEARRKRREAIKNKYKNQETSLLVQALRVGPDTAHVSVDASPIRSVSPSLSNAPVSAPGTPRTNVFVPPSPGDTDSVKEDDNLSEDVDPMNIDDPSAADYDPTIDMQEERSRHDKRLFKEDEQSTQKADQQVLEQSDLLPDAQQTNDLDMFAEEDNDMFAESPATKINAVRSAAKTLNATMLDNWDDPEGYYLTILGELIDNRYKVTQNLGRGMFASVIRAVDTKTDQLVALKIIRNNESMRKAGVKEIDILQNLAANDPDDRMHIVRLLRFLDHKNHLCMVFENLSMNLREVLKKYGRDVGISLKGIRAYSQQFFRGLSLLKKCQLLHADLKPDNILVNESRSLVKVADLGSASPITENVTAPYLVSRYYRAPEVILGITYDYGIDMWSIGCTLFELYTGKILFTGRNNNNMLRTIMECRGKFPNKLLRRGTLTYDYFDDLLNFKAVEPDNITGKMVMKVVDIKAKPIRDLRSRLIPKGKRFEEQEKKELEDFLDLLERCLALSPEKRITPAEALRHPFISKTK